MTIELEKYIDQRFRDLEERVALLAESQAQAVRTAAGNLEHRLEAMNELRDQINRERGLYLTSDVFHAETKAHAAADDRVHGNVDLRLRMIETTMANYAGRFWAVGILATLASLAVNLAIRFWR